MTELIGVVATDFCCFEQFLLPLRRQGLVWLGGDNHDSDAADSNGSGKSTVFKALSWGLHGETIDGEKGDKVIRHGAKCARVVIKMTGKWRIERERRLGAPRLRLFHGSDEFKADKAEVQAKINGLIGMDFRALRNTVLYGQRDRSRFVDPNTSDPDRKRVLHHILRTEILRICHEIIKQRNLAVKHDVDALEDGIRTAEARVEEHDPEELRVDSERWEKERTERVQAATLHARNHTNRAKEIAREVPDTKGLGARLTEIACQLIACDSATERATKLRLEVGALAEQLTTARGEQYAADASVSDLEGRLECLEGADRCPTCNSPLKKGEAATHIREMKVEVSRLNGEATAAQERADDTGERVTRKQTDAETEERKARAKFDLTREQGHIRTEMATAHTIADRAKDIAAVARDKIAETKEIQAEVNPHAAQIAKAEAAIKKHRRTIKAARAKLKIKAAERAHLEFWVRGFSPTGLPSFLLDSIMPYLTERANHYLDVLSDGDIQMGFSTQRELKSAKGEFRDEIDISWTIEGVEDYPPSGGQFKKMEVATDLALMDLAATREGGHLDLLCLDECLDGLDAEGRARIIQLLQGLRKSRGTIYVISHDPGVAEAFERAMVVTKRDGIARLEAA